MTARRLAIVAAVLASLSAAAWYGLGFVPASMSYGVEAEFEAVPPDDEELIRWARAQPGMASVGTNRRRVGGRWRVEVVFIIVRDFAGRPPLPDLDGAAAELGYRGPDGRFRDSPQ